MICDCPEYKNPTKLCINEAVHFYYCIIDWFPIEDRDIVVRCEKHKLHRLDAYKEISKEEALIFEVLES